MTRSQMIETVARKTGFTEAQVETTMDAMFDQIADCLRADEKVTIAGFGRFEMRPRKPKAYTNPKTKVSSRLESTSIPVSYTHLCQMAYLQQYPDRCAEVMKTVADKVKEMDVDVIVGPAIDVYKRQGHLQRKNIL